MDNERNIFDQSKPDSSDGNAAIATEQQPKLNGGAIAADTGVTRTIGGTIDPETARATASGTIAAPGNSPTSSETAKRGPGRPRKDGNAPQAKSEKTGNIEKSVNIDGIEKILFNLHLFAATLVVPELALEEKEAKELARSIKAVNEQYKLTLDPKQAAWIDLMTTCGIIYGPRAVAIYLRKQTDKKAVPAPLMTPAPNTGGMKPPPQNPHFVFNPGKIEVPN